ncbi:MAG: hypothetical protein K6D96_01910 [Acetatifactor sp.]|nr:hypothetical protein [Acetatifactor sp.]
MTGTFVSSLAGHDKGEIYLVLRDEGNVLYLINGTTKTVDKPKKKKLKHVQKINKKVNDDLYERLINNKKITDEEIKREIRLFMKQ